MYFLFPLHHPPPLKDVTLYGWEEPGIGRSITYMSMVAIAFFSILLTFEFRLISLALYYIRGVQAIVLPIIAPSVGHLNVDVQNEKDKVNDMTDDELEDYNLVVRNLTKFYGIKAAVKELCFAIERYMSIFIIFIGFV